MDCPFELSYGNCTTHYAKNSILKTTFFLKQPWIARDVLYTEVAVLDGI